MSGVGPRITAVVFDLLYTLVHPGTYPGGCNREGWLADILGVDAAVLDARWAAFEPILESGRALRGANGLEPELTWVLEVAADLGVTPTASDMGRIKEGWDLTRRAALLDPPPPVMSTLRELQRRNIPVGVLSNTHALELRAWRESPLASLVDVVALSHEIGACKPDQAAYAWVLSQLDVTAEAAAYVGDGSNDELEGAKRAGFSLVVLVEEALARSAPEDLPRYRAQADTSVASLDDLVELLCS
ncbi:MAG TPA: HAD family hydrolase [Acidimicrobiales bacterium]